MIKYTLAIVVVLLGLTWPSFIWSEDQPLEVQIVDALHKAFGTHPGFRANHAKGVVVEGNFKASSDAALLSKAKLFGGSTIPVSVRFSDATGIRLFVQTHLCGSELGQRSVGACFPFRARLSHKRTV